MLDGQQEKHPVCKQDPNVVNSRDAHIAAHDRIIDNLHKVEAAEAAAAAAAAAAATAAAEQCTETPNELCCG